MNENVRALQVVGEAFGRLATQDAHLSRDRPPTDPTRAAIRRAIERLEAAKATLEERFRAEVPGTSRGRGMAPLITEPVGPAGTKGNHPMSKKSKTAKLIAKAQRIEKNVPGVSATGAVLKAMAEQQTEPLAKETLSVAGATAAIGALQTARARGQR